MKITPHTKKSILRTVAGEKSVINRILPVNGFKSVEGFYVIAHRGASHYAPENTMPAFKEANRMNADLIELDVSLTRDGEPVVFHDDRLDRTTEAEGPINEYAFRELQELDAGSWFDEEFRGTRIPSLRTVMRWARNKIALNIEIKKKSAGTGKRYCAEEPVMDLIEHYDLLNMVVISSFNKTVLKRVKQIKPEAITALLNWEYGYGSRRSYRLMKNIGANGLNLQPRQMKTSLMKVLNKNNIPVWVYTVNDEFGMRHVMRRGATGIFSNRPDLLRRVAMDEFI